MNKKQRLILSNVYKAPLPKEKQEFLQMLNYPKSRRKEFIYSQIGYIQKKVWAVSGLLFMAMLLFLTLFQRSDFRLLWMLSAIFPFLALMTVTEITRSSFFGMAELEMTARYSLRSVLLARMGILGVENMILLLTVTIILNKRFGIGLIRPGVYLLVPYLITCSILFKLVNDFRSREMYVYSAGAAVAVSMIGLLLNSNQSAIYEQRYFYLWMITLLILVFLVGKGFLKLMKNTEELLWNSYLIA